MNILAIETSTSRGSVALLSAAGVLFESSFSAERGHSSALFAHLERALKIVKPDQIVVGLGPGSYSGVRVAIAAAIGLELATGGAWFGGPSVAAIETWKL